MHLRPDSTEEEFRAYSAAILARERAAACGPAMVAPAKPGGSVRIPNVASAKRQRQPASAQAFSASDVGAGPSFLQSGVSSLPLGVLLPCRAIGSGGSLAFPRKSNLDATGMRLVRKGCIVEFPGGTRCRVVKVYGGRFWQEGMRQASFTSCGDVRVVA